MTRSNKLYAKLRCPFPIEPTAKDAKPYQVREFLEIIEEHGLYLES